MTWPEDGNIIDVARRGEHNGYGHKRVIQRMWPEEGNINAWPEVGNIIVWPEEGNLTDVARRG